MPHFRHVFCLFVCAAIVSTTYSRVVAAGDAPAFFSAESVPPTLTLPDGAFPGKSRVVKVNSGLIRSGRLLLNLGIGPSLDVERTRSVDHGRGAWAWIGRVNGDPESQVILAGKGNSISGIIRYQGRIFRLQPIGKGKHLLSELSPSDPLPEVDPVPVPDLAVGDESGAQVSGDASATQVSAETIIDVMVVYTPAAAARYGGQDGIESLIALAVEETNQAYQNSQVDAQLRLVHAAEVAYTEADTMSNDLTNLAGKTDGFMDEIHALRDTYGADLVSLLQASGGACGLAYQMSSLNPAYEAYAFSVVYTECATGYYSFGHELGHNMGSTHDHENASSGVYGYSFGYQDPGSTFRTIMAYTCAGGCTRVQHFSNPYVNYAGLPTGEVDWADNALSLSNAAPLVATWRESAVSSTPPAAPSALAAATQSSDRIDLAWTDNAVDESGFRVERTDDGVTFGDIATLAANATNYFDTGLDPDTTYYYRVSTFNGSGSSDYSNDAWATTDPAPVLPPAAPSALSAATSSHTEISLAWADNADDETGFEVERSLDGGASWSLLATLVSDSTAFQDAGLAPESTCSYRVRATGQGGASAYSNAAAATTDSAPVYPPADPSGLVATAQSESAIQLDWNDNASDETGYEIERSGDGGQSWSLIASIGPNATSHLDSGLAPETFRLYRVRAMGEGGASGYSNEAGATTEAAAAVAPVCEATGSTGLALGTKSMNWTLSNTGTVALTIDRIELTWPSSQGSLRQVSLAGAQLWRGSDTPTSAAISSGWRVGESGRQIGKGAAATLGFNFKGRDKKDSQSQYRVSVHFAEGCSVQF